jgi:hypothetical protein
MENTPTCGTAAPLRLIGRFEGEGQLAAPIGAGFRPALFGLRATTGTRPLEFAVNMHEIANSNPGHPGPCPCAGPSPAPLASPPQTPSGRPDQAPRAFEVLY